MKASYLKDWVSKVSRISSVLYLVLQLVPQDWISHMHHPSNMVCNIRENLSPMNVNVEPSKSCNLVGNM